MHAELDQIHAALEERQTPLRVFVRDDDGGWGDVRLSELGDRMLDWGIPLDIAVIPRALKRSSIKTIGRLLADSRNLIGVHQHGYRHRNHERKGRKSEFGTTRCEARQREDIHGGWARLWRTFGESTTPIFTPPWNRCSSVTYTILAEMGYLAVSRIETRGLAEPRTQLPLPCCDVSVDWFRRKAGDRLSWPDWCAYAAGRCRSNQTLGLMLHHEHMDREEMDRLQALLDTLRAAPCVSFHSMADCVSSADA